MHSCAMTFTTEADEDARIRAHLTRALARCEEERAGELADAQRARRAEVLGALRRYIEVGRFPRNRVGNAPVPVFVDRDGARCAVAALLEATGEHALVARIARTRNLAHVDELSDDNELAEWLARNGLTALDAARIQPMYAAHSDAHWQPTVSVVGYAEVGGRTYRGFDGALGAGVRAGVRRVTRGSNNNGASIYGSLALVAEYDRHVVVGQGAAHRLALLAQWEPDGNTSDVQWYLLGGPALLLDDDDAPDGAIAIRLGAGLNFRTRSVPLLAELLADTYAFSTSVAVHVGINAGLVW